MTLNHTGVANHTVDGCVFIGEVAVTVSLRQRVHALTAMPRSMQNSITNKK